MASSTSLEGELNLVTRQPPQHKAIGRTRQQRTQRAKSDQHSLSRDRTMSSNTAPISIQSIDISSADKMSSKSPSAKGNRHHKRNLREKRRPTGVFHTRIFSTESTGGTSSGSEEDDSDVTSKRNTLFNEIILTNAEDKDDEDDAEKDEDRDDETPEELRSSNVHLREQIRIKEAYIKQLEEKIVELEVHVRRQHQEVPIIPDDDN